MVLRRTCGLVVANQIIFVYVLLFSISSCRLVGLYLAHFGFFALARFIHYKVTAGGDDAEVNSTGKVAGDTDMVGSAGEESVL
jgi:hypothetical protein